MEFRESSSNEFQLSPIERKAYELLADSNQKINEREFTDYDKDMIESDLNLVAEYEADFEKKNTKEQNELKKVSTVFEVLFSELVELYDWMGNDAFVVNTSKFDDIVGGTDMVAEFHKDGQHNYLGLAIDVTFSKDQLEKKLRSIASNIEDNKLATIKYFRSGNGDTVGRLNNIPRVVVGASRQVINELAESKLTLESLKNRKNNPTPSEDIKNLTQQIKDTKAKLANHPFQFEILGQLIIQAQKYKNYALSVGQPQIAEKYSTILNIIESILTQKEKDSDLMRASSRLEKSDKSMDLISLKIEENLNDILRG